MMVFIGKVNNYMFRPKAALLQVITITILLKEHYISHCLSKIVIVIT